MYTYIVCVYIYIYTRVCLYVQVCQRCTPKVSYNPDTLNPTHLKSGILNWICDILSQGRPNSAQNQVDMNLQAGLSKDLIAFDP